MPGELIDIGGRTLHAIVRRGGHGPAVVFEAGLSLTSLSWWPVLDRLSGVASCVAYDRACTGWSSHGAHPRNAAAVTADLLALLNKLRLQPPYVFVGHSAGGPLALRLASHYPGHVAGLILVDAAPPRQVEVFRAPGRYRRMLDAINWQLFRRRTLALARLGRCPPPPPCGDPEADAWLARLHRELPQQAVGWLRCEVPGLPESLNGTELPSLAPVPLEVLWAVPDKPAPHWSLEYTQRTWRALQEELAAASPRGRAQPVDGSSHMILTDRPDVVAEAVLRVLHGEAGAQSDA